MVLWAATATRFSPWFEGLYFKKALQRVLWSALTRQQHAYKFKFELRNLDLQVLNGATGPPEHLQQPWQLFGTGAARLHGLPPSQLANGPICSKILLPSLQAGERERVMLLGYIGL